MFNSEISVHIIELADEASFNLPNASAGWCFLIVGDTEEYAHFVWNTSGVPTLMQDVSANIVTSDTDTKFCIIDDGTSVKIKNHLGATKKVMYKYECTTTP